MRLALHKSSAQVQVHQPARTLLLRTKLVVKAMKAKEVQEQPPKESSSARRAQVELFNLLFQQATNSSAIPCG
jgi:hypothetical protein